MLRYAIIILLLAIPGALASPDINGVLQLSIDFDGWRNNEYVEHYGFEDGVWKYLYAAQPGESGDLYRWIRVEQQSLISHVSHAQVASMLIDKTELEGFAILYGLVPDAFEGAETTVLVGPTETYLEQVVQDAEPEGPPEPEGYILTVEMDNRDPGTRLVWDQPLLVTTGQWLYESAAGWVPVTQSELAQSQYIKEIVERLATLEEEEGYDYLYALDQEFVQGVTIYGFPLAYEFKQYFGSLPDPETSTEGTGQGSGDESTDDGITASSPDDCGVHRGFIKFCYNPGSIYSYNPIRDDNAIDTFVQRMAQDNQAGEGFILVVYDSDNAGDARERRLQEKTRSAIRATPGVNYLLVSDTLPEEAADEDLQHTAFLISDRYFDNPGVRDVLNDIPQGTALSVARSSGVKEGYDVLYDQFLDTLDDEEVNQLRDRVKEKTGITVEVIPQLDSGTVWQTQDLDTLTAQLNQYQIEIQACAAYILVDREKVDVYQSSRYCRLRIAREDLQREDPVEQIIQLLRSAERNTPAPSASELMLTAYQLTAQGNEINNKDEGVELSEFILNNERFSDEKAYPLAPMSMRAAGVRIVQAKHDVMQADPQAALRMLAGDTIFAAYPNMRTVGALVALEAARMSGDCQELSNQMGKYQSVLPTSREVRDYERELNECTFRQVRRQCQLVQTGFEQDNALVDITFINDGLPEADFNASVQKIAELVLSTPNLNEYPTQFSFKKATGASQLTESRGELLPPRVNAKAVTAAGKACYGDVLAILSEEEYYPSTIAGNSFISASGCGYDDRCMSIYLMRTLGFSVFDLDEERNSVMAPLATQPFQRSTLERVFSQDHQEVIRGFFGVRGR